MFRRIMILMAALAVAAAGWSLPAQAAPVSGSATLEIVFTPANFYDCLAGTGFEPCKIDKILVKMEADLVLTLSVSGVDITSTSVFTFKGLEFQSFTFTGTVGALAFRSVLIFAPNIVEVQLIRDAFGRPRYCVNASDPGGLPSSWNCVGGTPAGFTQLWNLLEDITHPVVGNLTLANIFDTAGHLDPALTFRKKIAELSLSLAGLTIGLRGLFANIGSAPAPDWNFGVVASVEGQTVSGITIRAETWIGARQGLECFGECKPLERIRGGKVETNFIIYEEKIFIRNLKIAGVTFGARLEFTFSDAPSYLIGLSFLQLTQDFALAPFGLTVNNVINIQPNPVTNALTIVQDVITTSVKVGDVSVLAQFVIRPAVTGAFNIFFAQLISTFDAPGVKVTDILVPCIDENVCPSLFPTVDGLLDHNLILSTSVGDVTLDIGLYFSGLFRGFYQAIIEVGWQLGNVTIRSSSVIGVDALLGQKIGIELKF
jgi:hypothetical protein